MPVPEIAGPRSRIEPPRKGLFHSGTKNRISAWHIGKARYSSAIPDSETNPY